MKTYCGCCDKTYPNDDELAFHHWLVEAMKYGHIKGWGHQFPTFPLSGKFRVLEFSKKTGTAKMVTKREHTYTPDFWFSGASKKLLELIPEIAEDVIRSYFDVKPSFEKNHSRTEAFRVNQKWMRFRHGIFVRPVVPKDFFHRTWVPEKLAFRLNGTRRTPFAECRLVCEI